MRMGANKIGHMSACQRVLKSLAAAIVKNGEQIPETNLG